MFVRANFVNIYSQGMRDRSMRSGTELAREIKLTDWSMAGNLSNRSSGRRCAHYDRTALWLDDFQYGGGSVVIR